MRKIVISGLVLSGLLSIAFAVSTSRSLEETLDAAPITVRDLLNAHNVQENPIALSRFIGEARRTVSWAAGVSSRAPRSFTRLVSVARDGQMFNYQRVDPLAPTRQIDLFDGRATYHAVIGNGRLIEETMRPGDSPPEAVGFEIRTFGLLPVLSQLAGVKTESIYRGPTASGLVALQVTVSTRRWTVFSDSKRLIRRVEFQDYAIDYDDYRLVEGVWLPFAQRFYVRGQLYYELSFGHIDVRPEFSTDYFSRDAFLNEVRR
jgi:hypothetical protein